MNKITLYIGLNDKDRKVQIIDNLEAVKIVINILNHNNISGATVFNATGLYTHDDGKVVIENTLRVELFEGDRVDVIRAIEAIKIALNQESVVLNTETVNTEFI